MFSTARAKIDRARKHLESLNSECRSFLDAKPYDLRQELDAERGNGILVYYPTAPVPIPISLIIGDLLYNLRSALDHVVYDLGGGLPMTEFPIFEDKGLFYQTRKNSTEPTNISGLYKIRGVVNQATRKLIEDLQPFNFVGENPGDTSALLLLKKLCNIDKHRTLHLGRVQESGVTLQFSPRLSGTLNTADLAVRELEDRAVVAWWCFEGNEDMKVEAKLDLHIAFDEGEIPTIVGVGIESVCRHLIGLADEVVDAVESTVSV